MDEGLVTISGTLRNWLWLSIEAAAVELQVLWLLLPGARAEVLVVGHPGEEGRRGCDDAGAAQEIVGEGQLGSKVI